MWTEPSDDEIDEILRTSRTVAMVGASANPDRASNRVGNYLKDNSHFTMWFVNPAADEILGEPTFPDLDSLPAAPDIVDVFRRPEHLPAVLDAAIAAKARVLWLQLGLYDEGIASRAEAAGLKVVMNRCMKIEFERYSANT